MDFFKNMLINQYGENLADKIIAGLSVKRKTTLRVNTLKTDEVKIKNRLDELNIIYSEVSWSKNALIIENSDETILQNTDIYKNGEIYLQSLSSILPPIILSPMENTDILDMTAAPGGKTTEIAALTNNNANITACEKNKIRFQRLKYNVEKQNATSIFLMQKDARFLDDFFSFDQILLDAPCSGSGTLNLSEENNNFTEDLIHKSCILQKKLLSKAIKLLKKNHTMVYSTCSILKQEDEDILRDFIDNGKIKIIPIDENLSSNLPTLPTKIDGTLCVAPTKLYEGFFVAKIYKVQ